jgi:hypothetical protein
MLPVELLGAGMLTSLFNVSALLRPTVSPTEDGGGWPDFTTGCIDSNWRLSLPPIKLETVCGWDTELTNGSAKLPVP